MTNELGTFLEKLRGKTSLRDAAKKSGLSHTYIRDLELGVNRVTKTTIRPTPETLGKLSEAYNYPYNELMKMAGYMEEEKEKATKKEVADKFIEYLEQGLSNAEIINLMNFRVDDIPLSVEEANEFVDWVRVKRAMRKQQQTVGGSKEL